MTSSIFLNYFVKNTLLNSINKIVFYLLFLSLLFTGKYSFAQLQFIENKGQWNSNVNFWSDINSGAFFLEKNGFTVLLQNSDDLRIFSDHIHGHLKTDSSNSSTALSKNRILISSPQMQNDNFVIRSHAYKVSFAGSSKNVEVQSDKALPTYNNYFIGNDKSKWQSNCKIFQGVTYKNMYPNIDVRYYTDAGTLKYDIIVHPGGNVGDIALKYDGIDKLSIRNKELIIKTSVGEVKELYPYTFEVAKTGRTSINCKYILKNNTVTFKVDSYSPDATIVIDPTLIF